MWIQYRYHVYKKDIQIGKKFFVCPSTPVVVFMLPMLLWRTLLSLLTIVPGTVGFAAWLKCDRRLEEDEVRLVHVIYIYIAFYYCIAKNTSLSFLTATT